MKGILVVPAAIALTAALAAAPAAASPTPFQELLSRYHEIRSELVVDRFDGVAEPAGAIRSRATELGREADAAGASVPEDRVDEWQALLTEISAAADRLASAGDLASAREAFYDLSKPMGRYRKMMSDDSSIVVYCPMAKKAWLQPDGEITNPYLGQEMPACGNKIPDRVQ